MGANSVSVRSEVRCPKCDRLLCECLNEITAGRVTLVPKCQGCGKVYVAIVKEA